MCIYTKNNRAKFHPDPIWDDEALGFFVKCQGCQMENLMSNQKSDSANQCAYKQRTFVPNFILIWFEMTELGHPNKKDKKNKNKMSSDRSQFLV